jgi:cytolysin (calcineurin-like family phosphatase)
VNSLTGLKTALTLNNVNNTTDLTKPISTLTQTALDLKLNAADTSKYTKQTYSDSALLTKLSTTGNATTATLAGNITATTNTTLTSLSNLATVGTITSGVWSGTAVAVEKGGTGATTASAARTNLGLVIGTDVQAPLVAGTNYLAPTGSAASLTNFPTFNQNTTGNAATATTAGNITATTNTTLTSLSSLATVGTITSGVWSGTAVAVEKGGTGATTASAARTNLGLVIGTDVQAPLVAGTNYLAPTGSAASLTNFPTFNQNTTGNATTATLAGNITATTNTTLTSLSNLATVGTITSGVWSGTAVAVEKGGTGLTAAGTSGQVLTSTGSGTLTWTTPASSSSNNSNELTGIIILGKNISGVNEVWKSNFDGSSQSKINIAGLPANYEIPSDSYRISADGQTIFFLLYTPTGGQHIYKCNIDGSGLSKIINDVDEIASLSGFYSPNTTHYVGELYGGGIVFSVYKGSDGLEHGLIVALTEQESTKWQNTGALVNATRTEDGVFNTALMTGSPAANYITSLGAGWYLPSIDELGLLYYNRYNVQKALRAGSYTLLSNTAIYWSSTEYDATNAYGFIFGGGSGGGFNNGEDKTNLFTVRGVRTF